MHSFSKYFRNVYLVTGKMLGEIKHSSQTLVSHTRVIISAMMRIRWVRQVSNVGDIKLRKDMWVIYCKRNQVMEVLKLKGSYCWNLVDGDILTEESETWSLS